MRTKGYRGNRKRARRVVKKPKMSFSSRVLSVVNKRQDVKVGTPLTQSINDVREGITAANFATNQFPIMGAIAQGTGENNRIGNRITLKKIVIRGYYKINFPVGSAANTRLLMRNLILRQRSIEDGCSIGTAALTLSYNNLLEPSQAYLGAIADYNTPINANAFIQKKQFKRSLSMEYDGVALDAVGVSSSYVFYNYTMTFGKGKVLNYTTGGAITPVDFPYFMVHSATLLGSGAALPVGMISWNSTATPYFTDD